MKGRHLVSLIATLILTTSLLSQNNAAFEVAVIKRNVSGSENKASRVEPGGRIVISNNTLFDIIRIAWQLQPFQIAGGTDWMNKDRWDINAKAPEAKTFPPQELLLMVKHLLADQFKLLTHTEMRDTNVFALVIARSNGKFGPQFRKSGFDCAAIFSAAEKGDPTSPSDRGICGETTGSSGTVRARGVLLRDFAKNLSSRTGRFIVDKTGLVGYYDIDLQFAPDQLAPESPDHVDDAPSLFTAIFEQLGLKLEAQRLPIETLVIDSAQRPADANDQH
jgi:uncharacterized protein (TIGR03435 family)